MTEMMGMERQTEGSIVSVEEETVVRTLKVVPSISEVSTAGGSLSVKGSDNKGTSEQHTIQMAKIKVRLDEI